MNLAALSLRSWMRPVMGLPPPAPGAREVAKPSRLAGTGDPGRAARRDTGSSITPGCRLCMEGWDGQDGACDILELSSHGVTIALNHAPRSPWSERGELLIGLPGEDHYAVPVSVRRVRHSPEASILELVIQDGRWSYHASRKAITDATNR